MIRCDAVERWLNDGMPLRDAAAARAHARRCAACDRAIAAAVALEAMLVSMGTAAGSAPVGFTDGVMARIDAEGAGARAPRATASRAPWWLVFASEPAAAVAIALVPALAAIALFFPSARDLLVASTRLAVSSSMAAALNGATAAAADASAFLATMSPAARALLAAGLVPLVLWSTVAALRGVGRMR